MYRKVEDFLTEWSEAAQGTLQVLESLTDEKLGQSIVEGHSTLGWLGYHLATSPAFFVGLTGAAVKATTSKTAETMSAKEIVDAYQKIVEDVTVAVEKTLTDEKLVETIDVFGKQMTIGAILRLLLNHQTHHRGQMTVLLRQAGLPVPGILGPTKEQQM